MLFVLLLILHCPSADARAPRLFHIVLQGMNKDARLMGFDLAIASGRVAALRDCPPGWRIEIDNDAAWHANISARATVGAAALDADALQALILLAPAPVAVADPKAGAFSVKATATVMRHGDVSRITLHGLRLEAIDQTDLTKGGSR